MDYYMSDHKIFGTGHEMENELISILIRSSLYDEMAAEERQELLNYLVSSYFSNAPGKYSRALPEVM